MRRTVIHAADTLVNAVPFAGALVYRGLFGSVGRYVAYSRRIPGWLGRAEAVALARACAAQPDDAVVVEIGSFLGKSAVVMAGARKLRGTGTVHCIDPFDASGDAFSVPVYRSIATGQRRSLRQQFDENVSRAGLTSWVRVHEGTAASVAPSWTDPIDLLFLDGDQSPAGARLAFDLFAPFLKVGGTLALHNSSEREYDPTHSGHYLLAANVARPPHFGDRAVVDTTTFVRKLQ